VSSLVGLELLNAAQRPGPALTKIGHRRSSHRSVIALA
jgi:hypothetical protein